LLTVIGVGLIILIAACFNYTNLTIARALSRAKEVGIRKVSGASRYQIFFQYIVEAVLIALLALVFACLIFIQFQPGEHLSFSLLFSFFLFVILTGSVAGAFPAWILSSFKPVNVLKNITAHKLFGNLSLQKGLLIFQFTLSLVIIIFLSAYYRQFSYLKTLDPGFYAKNIITIPSTGKDKVFANQVSQFSGVRQLYRVSENFGMRGGGSIPVFRMNLLLGRELGLIIILQMPLQYLYTD
jgi:putative ABC transport system permease protein